ncbi:hypothetical protein FCOL_05370 [Flavobacterium columnare ATCC 49512]|uniref:Uncharacterized protein n=1 Tax=Flavobacterium columnare (strain ATCC 49512 / CIP 103533 / TG 44/87) TaxID=1041826 RepID=G8X9F2_FLACA|nr:hypothetical protein [Flavobacterium columnare]AEW85899.1 hypothetical protein FCOL_05370 [Flavobacterium columnare ATCC 49512]
MAKKEQMLVKLGDSTFDKIQAYYVNPDKNELSETVNDIRLRWLTVLNLRRNGYAKFKVANMLERDYGLSQAQAYIDIRNAESLFGDIYKTDKDVERMFFKEQVADFIKRARKKGDLKAEAKGFDLWAKYGGFEEDDVFFDADKFEKKDIEIAVDPKLVALMKKMFVNGVVDFNNIDATDIDFTIEEDGAKEEGS